MSSKQIPTLQQFIDALDDHVWVKDADRKYIAVNKSVESAWNMPRSDIFGKTDFDLFAKSRSEHYQKADDRVIDSGVQETVEECASRDAYGHDVWLETIKSPIQQPDGELIGVIA